MRNPRRWWGAAVRRRACGRIRAGPLVAAIEVRYEDWRCAVAGIDGRPSAVTAQRHSRGDRTQAVGRIADALQDLRREHGRRLRAVSIAIAGVCPEGRLAEPNTFGWGAADLSAIVADSGLAAPDRQRRDARRAGRARGGSGAGAGTVLHLTVEVGLGGVLVVDGVRYSAGVCRR